MSLSSLVNCCFYGWIPCLTCEALPCYCLVVLPMPQMRCYVVETESVLVESACAKRWVNLYVFLFISLAIKQLFHARLLDMRWPSAAGHRVGFNHLASNRREWNNPYYLKRPWFVEHDIKAHIPWWLSQWKLLNYIILWSSVWYWKLLHVVTLLGKVALMAFLLFNQLNR